MPNHSAPFALLLLLTGAACVDTPPSPQPLTGTGQTLDPSIWEQSPAATFGVLLTANVLPNWHVELPQGGIETTRRIEVVAGQRTEWRLRADRAATIEIPAMRVRAELEPGTPKTIWFWPVTPGEYDVLVRSGQEQFDGKVVVVDEPERAEAALPEGVDEARLAEAKAAREQVVGLQVEQWRPTGNGDETMRWLIPIPAVEFSLLDPLLASAERVVDAPTVLAISSHYGLLLTKHGVYRFRFSSDKIAGRTCRATLTPLEAQAGRERITFVWDHEAGERLMTELESLLEVYAAKAIPTGETRGGSWFK